MTESMQWQDLGEAATWRRPRLGPTPGTGLSLALVGINHRSAPLPLLEQMTVPPRDLPKALADLSGRAGLDEVTVLSTCMRTEVYASARQPSSAMAEITGFFSAWSGLPAKDFSDRLYTHFGLAAVEHLFRVASGLDSAALGEPEVLGQVRHAWDIAVNEGASGKFLSAAFRHAVQAGKRARAETKISRGTTSLPYAALDLAIATAGDLAGKQVLIVGLGEVGEKAAQAFTNPAGPPIALANRTASRSEVLAQQVGGAAVAWEALDEAVAAADVVVCCASGHRPVLDGPRARQALAGRPERERLFVDLAVPRSIAAEVAAIAGVTLLNIEDVAAHIASRLDERRREVPAVEGIVDEEVERFASSAAELSVAPLVRGLHERAEDVRRSELLRLKGLIGHLSPAEEQDLDTMTRRIVAKLLHEPTVKLKAASGTPEGAALADAFSTLFGLGP